MPGGKVTGTNHTSFTIGELGRVAAFFEDLGLEVVHLRAASRGVMESVTGVEGAEVRVAYVKCPNHQIELFEYFGPPGRTKARPRPGDVGAAQVAFEVDGLAAIV